MKTINSINLTGGLSEPKIIEPISCAIRGRTPQNSPIDKQADTHTEQHLELGGDAANCLTSVQKDSMVVESCILGYTRDSKGHIQNYHEKSIMGTVHTHIGSGGNTCSFVRETFISVHPVSRTLEFKGTDSLKDISPALRATDYKCPHCVYEPEGQIVYRIRKLTPRECFRLQGMDDADIDNIDAYRIKTTLKNGTVKEKPISKSQKYKMAGNSIVVDVLYHIFYQMFIAEPPKQQPKQLTLFNL